MKFLKDNAVIKANGRYMLHEKPYNGIIYNNTVDSFMPRQRHNH